MKMPHEWSGMVPTKIRRRNNVRARTARKEQRTEQGWAQPHWSTQMKEGRPR
jgi:hypothetical protein